jgi:hypothetical protein
MKAIDDEMRRKIFGLIGKAYDLSGSSLPLNDWRQEQQRAVGIESLRDCPAELGLKLMNRLHRAIEDGQRAESMEHGGKPKAPAGKRATCMSPVRRMEGHPCEGQLRKVYALLTDMSLSWEYADGMAARMYGQKRTEQLTPNELRGLIAALMKRQQKHGGRRTEAAHG